MINKKVLALKKIQTRGSKGSLQCKRMKPWVEMQPHYCRSTGKEVKTSLGRDREGFSEEVAVEEVSGGN